jgi:site-specific DNA recombinase
MSRRLKDIQTVAIYLRKSRGDEATDLEKHRQVLVDLCHQHGWQYVEYAEIGTGDSIAARPKMQELLQDVAEGRYDGVVVVHYDRLGRGDKVDQATIEKTFEQSDTLIITPEKVYDLAEESDMMLADFLGMIARQEYKAIARRLRKGKADGAKMGNWTNGTPPLGYRYNRTTKKLEPDIIDEEKQTGSYYLYRMILEKMLQGYTASDVAWELNSMGIPSPRGGYWQPAVIRRLVTSEVHLGHIVVGKKRKLVTSGAIVHKPKDEWIIYKNCHPAIKTQEEHDKILFLLQRDMRRPHASRAGKNAFSGLVKCAKCGNTLQIQKRKDRSDHVKSCTHRDPFGVRCVNYGGSVDVLREAIHDAIRRESDKLQQAIEQGISLEEHQVLLELANHKEAEIKKIEKRIKNLNVMRADGELSKEEFLEMKFEAEAQKQTLLSELELLNKQLDRSKEKSYEDRLSTIRGVIKVLETATDPKMLNRAYKSIIHEVTWERNDIDEKPKIAVKFSGAY